MIEHRFFCSWPDAFPILKDPDISANHLNPDIDVINKWAHQWKFEFNSDPLIKQTNEILFSCKNNGQTHPQIIFNWTVVAKVEEQKDLGLILESIKFIFWKIPQGRN